MTVDRDARDRQAAEARLAEKGMWLEEDIHDGARIWTVYRYKFGVLHEREIVASGTTWRQAVSEALQEPAF